MSLDLPAFSQVSDPGSADAQQFLTQLRKYDPSAGYVAQSQIQGGGEGGAGPSGTIYRLSYDPSKLPGLDGTGQLSQQTSSVTIPGQSQGYDTNFIPVNDSNVAIDPNKVTHSPIYGDVMNRSNSVVPDDKSWLDWVGPLAVMAFGGAAGGLPALFGDGLTGGATAGGDLSDLGTGAMDLTGSAGTGIPGSTGLLDTSPGFQFGMGDHGLGTTLGSEAGTTGVLSPEEIAGLGPGNGFGMHDRGLGTTTGAEAGTTGVLSPSEISGLSPSLLDQLLNKLPSGSDLLGKLPQLLTALGGAPGGGGMPGFSGGGGGGGGNGEDAVSIIRRFYGQDALSKLKAQHG